MPGVLQMDLAPCSTQAFMGCLCSGASSGRLGLTLDEGINLSARTDALAVDDRRHPVRCVARRSGFSRLALKVVNRRNRREARTIAQAVHIDDRARSPCRFRDCRDEDTATAADQKIAGAGSEAVILDQ